MGLRRVVDESSGELRDGSSGGAVRSLDHQWYAVADGICHFRIIGNPAGERRFGFEKDPGRPSESLVNFGGCLVRFDSVDECEQSCVSGFGHRFECGVGICECSRFRRGDDQHGIGGGEECSDGRVSGVSGVEHHDVVFGFELAELLSDVVSEAFVRVDGITELTGAGDDVDVGGSVEGNVCQASCAGQDVSEVPVPVESAHQVEMSESEAGVEQCDLDIESCEGDGEVECEAALADASLATGHGDHAGRDVGVGTG